MSRSQRVFVWIGVAVTCLVGLWLLNTGIGAIDNWLSDRMAAYSDTVVHELNQVPGVHAHH